MYFEADLGCEITMNIEKGYPKTCINLESAQINLKNTTAIANLY